jgi:hypothetical protein
VSPLLQQVEGEAKNVEYSLPTQDPQHAESRQSGGRYVKFLRDPSWKLKRERLQQWLPALAAKRQEKKEVRG